MADARRQTVQIDSSSITGKDLGAVVSTTMSVAIASNPNAISILIVGSRGTGGQLSSASRDGNNYTKAKGSTVYDGCFTEIWYLVNPDRDTGDITVNFSGTCSNRSYIGHIALYNVDQKDPVNITDEASANAGSISSTFTATENNCVAVEGQFNTGNTPGTLNAGQTEIHKRSAGDSGGCSYETDIDAQSETVGWANFETGTTAVSQAVVVFQGCIPSGGAFLLNFI